MDGYYGMALDDDVDVEMHVGDYVDVTVYMNVGVYVYIIGGYGCAWRC